MKNVNIQVLCAKEYQEFLQNCRREIVSKKMGCKIKKEHNSLFTRFSHLTELKCRISV